MVLKLHALHRAFLALCLTVCVFSTASAQSEASELAVRGRELLRRGVYAQADSLLTRALSLLPEDSPEYIGVLTDRIELCIESDRIEGLRPQIDRVLEARAADPGRNSLEYAEITNHLGKFLTYNFKFAEAEAAFTEALRIRREVLGEESLPYAYSLICLGTACAFKQAFAEAEHHYTQAREIAISLGDHLHHAMADLCLASVYTYTGRISQALELFPNALKMYEEQVGSQHINYITNLTNYGALYLVGGDYAKAEPLLVRALELAEQVLGREHRQYLNTLGMLTTLCLNQGRYEEAEGRSSQFVAISTKVYGDASPLLAQGLNQLSTICINLGNYQKAEQSSIQALEILKQNPDALRRSKATTLNTLGVVYLRQQRFDQALACFNEALDAQQENKLMDNFLTLSIVGNISTALLESPEKDFPAIEQRLLSALEALSGKYGVGNTAYLAILTNLGAIYRATGQYDRALACFSQAMEDYRHGLGERNWQFINLLDHYCRTFQEAGRITEALASYRQCLVLMQELALRDFLFLTEQEREQYWQAYNARLNRFMAFAAEAGDVAAGFAYDCVLFTKSLLLSSSLARQQAVIQSHDEELIALWRQMKSLRGAAQKDEAVELERRLLAEVQKSDSGTGFTTAWEQVQAMLGEDEAAIEVVNFPDDTGDQPQTRYAALVLTPSAKHPVWAPLCTERELLHIMDESDSMYDLLYERVWSSIDGHLQGVDKVYLSLSGLFNTLSFEAMRNQGNYLTDRYKLHRLLSTREIAGLKTGISAHTEKPSLSLFGGADFGMPPAPVTERTAVQQTVLPADDAPASLRLMRSVVDNLRRDRGQGFDYLPGSLREVTTIGKLTEHAGWDVSLFCGAEASEARLKSCSSRSPQMLHISTHGFYFAPPHNASSAERIPGSKNTFGQSEDPLVRSGLLLSGANSIWTNAAATPDDGNDGVLTAYEIAALDLSGTELVILSACDTALGDIDYNEGVYGIQRAFRLAGVRSMIISLWKVPDAETVDLMTEFYKNRISGMTVKEAFDRAQSALRAAHPDDTQSWAGFILVQ